MIYLNFEEYVKHMKNNIRKIEKEKFSNQTKEM